MGATRFEMTASGFARARSERVSVVQADPELLPSRDPARRACAERRSLARVRRSEPGPWRPRWVDNQPSCGLGFLLLTGTLVRHISVKGRACAELLGAGDVVSPQDVDGAESTVGFEARWRALRPLSVAVLDDHWARRMAPFPEVTTELAARLLQRSPRLLRLAVIAEQRRLDDRVRLAIVELADRFGHMHPDGIHLDLPLTHELLAELVGARRPSVSAACGRLARAGDVTRAGHGWLLRREPARAVTAPTLPAAARR
jgi:CRP/FNR family transcriptional regulator, cyclic AMP receptor protein